MMSTRKLFVRLAVLIFPMVLFNLSQSFNNALYAEDASMDAMRGDLFNTSAESADCSWDNNTVGLVHCLHDSFLRTDRVSLHRIDQQLIWMKDSDLLQAVETATMKENAVRKEQVGFLNNKNNMITDHVVLRYIGSCATFPSMSELVDLVPAYARNLTILLDRECNFDTVEIPSRRNASLSEVFPWTKINVQVCASSDRCYEVMMKANLLICASSSALDCNLAALLRPASTMSTVVGNSPFLSKVKVKPHGFRIIETDKRKWSSCHKSLRSHALGSWHFNETARHESHYNEPFWLAKVPVESKKITSSVIPQRFSAYSWVPPCEGSHPVSRMHKDGFCDTMQRLNLTRFMAAGDSLQFMVMLSLMHFLGYTTDKIELRKHKRSGYNMRASQIIVCDKGFEVEMVFHRTNHLMPLRVDTNITTKHAILDVASRRFNTGPYNKKRDNTLLKQAAEYYSCDSWIGPFPDSQGKCPWVNEYLSKNVPTLLWTGVGAHFHHEDVFVESMDYLMTILEENKRPKDVIMFRTANAGHKDCMASSRAKETPYGSFEEYQSDGVTTKYDWHLLYRYNKYMEELVWRGSGNEWEGAKLGLTDIYWSSSMRRDGHATPEDCLHYLLPGPPDWWVHLLYADLVELATGMA